MRKMRRRRTLAFTSLLSPPVMASTASGVRSVQVRSPTGNRLDRGVQACGRVMKVVGGPADLYVAVEKNRCLSVGASDLTTDPAQSLIPI